MDLWKFKSIKLREKKAPIQKEKGETQWEDQFPKPKQNPKAKATPFDPSIPHTSDKVTILSLIFLESHGKALNWSTSL